MAVDKNNRCEKLHPSYNRKIWPISVKSLNLPSWKTMKFIVQSQVPYRDSLQASNMKKKMQKYCFVAAGSGIRFLALQKFSIFSAISIFEGIAFSDWVIPQ